MDATGAARVLDAADPTPGASLVEGSLSPSRAADFKNCPLLYRFRVIDRLPQAPSLAATRGTLVHAALERLYDLPAVARTPQAARDMVGPQWQRLVAEDPARAELFAEDSDGAQLARWLDSARELVGNYFALEDPTRLEPAAREQLVEAVVDGLRLRGYVDRLDVSPAGDLRVVDYKTGAMPGAAFESHALFQMKFYALVLWRSRGVLPRQLKLLYLADRDALVYTPDADELNRFERTLRAIWAAIAEATRSQRFQPNPGRLCDWCDHQERCPAFGGTPPPFPTEALATSSSDRRRGQAPGGGTHAPGNSAARSATPTPASESTTA